MASTPARIYSWLNRVARGLEPCARALVDARVGTFFLVRRLSWRGLLGFHWRQN
jgi:hypothetical protein